MPIHIHITSLTGTSACSHGTFYCVNGGVLGKEISSTFVDDGVCDCCDGSDETDGCGNTCHAVMQQKRNELQTKLEQYEAGFKARTLLVTEAAKKWKEWQALHNELSAKVPELKAQVATLEGTLSSSSIFSLRGSECVRTVSFSAWRLMPPCIVG
jgi:protein kinase C substrate 80K-H